MMEAEKSATFIETNPIAAKVIEFDFKGVHFVMKEPVYDDLLGVLGDKSIPAPERVRRILSRVLVEPKLTAEQIEQGSGVIVSELVNRFNAAFLSPEASDSRSSGSSDSTTVPA